VAVDGSDSAFQGALAKVNFLAAFCAGVRLVEFVGEYLFAFTAFGAFAVERFQVLEILITGAMLGSRHWGLLFIL
jgi:hypothetical protein